MNINLAKDFFSKLLNSDIKEDTTIRLTSAQSARAYAWLKSNNFQVDDFPLGKGFTLQQLFFITSENNASESVATKKSKISCSSEVCYDSTGELGVDIQSVRELFPDGLPVDPKSDPELLGIFTVKELSYAQSKTDSLQTLTGIFAAKEAIQKCSSKKIGFLDIEVLPDKSGRPKTDFFVISISHSQDYAVAIAANRYLQKPTLVDEEKPEQSKKTISTKDNIFKQSIFANMAIPILVVLLVLVEVIRFFQVIR